jgi:hypothetical protein
MAATDYNLDYLRVYNKQLVVLSSANKIYPTDTPTNFNISFASNSNQITKLKKIDVTSITFNNLFNNVASYSNSFVLSYTPSGGGGQSVVVTIPTGFWNATQIASLIQSFITTNVPALSTFTCTFDTTTYLFSMASNNPSTTIQILPIIFNPSYGNNNQPEGTLAWNIGFVSLPTADAVSITAPVLPSLNIQNVYIYSVKLSNARSYRSNGAYQSTVSNQLISIPLATVPYGATCNWLASGSERGITVYPMENTLDSIDFQLKNEYGSILETQQNSNTSIEFSVYY